MNLSFMIGRLQRDLARSSFVLWLCRKVRNQCQAIIGYSYAATPDSRFNGEFWLCRQLAPHCKVFVDVGANVGNWTEHFLTLISRENRGFLVEPSKLAQKQLRERFEGRDSVKIFDFAVSDADGTATFFEEAHCGETSSIVPGVSNSSASSSIVTTRRLDEFLAEQDVDSVDFLKIDVEGHDLYAIKGATKYLKEQKIKAIQFEYNESWINAGSTLRSAYTLLTEFGYEVYVIQPDAILPFDFNVDSEFFRYSNFLAITPAFRKLAKLHPSRS